MAIFTKIEFAHALGMGRSSVSNWISRGQLFINDDGLIDDQDPRNRKKIDARLKLIGGNYKPPAEISESRNKERKTRREKKKQPTGPKVERVKKQSVSDGDDLDRKKKQAEINLKLEQIEHLQLKSAKLKGDNVPAAHVETTFIVLGKSFQTGYKDSTETLLSKLVHECKIPPEIHSKYKDLWIKMINKTHGECVDVAKNELSAIANEVSGKIAMENE